MITGYVVGENKTIPIINLPSGSEAHITAHSLCKDELSGDHHPLHTATALIDGVCSTIIGHSYLFIVVSLPSYGRGGGNRDQSLHWLYRIDYSVIPTHSSSTLPSSSSIGSVSSPPPPVRSKLSQHLSTPHGDDDPLNLGGLIPSPRRKNVNSSKNRHRSRSPAFNKSPPSSQSSSTSLSSPPVNTKPTIEYHWNLTLLHSIAAGVGIDFQLWCGGFP